MKYLDLFGIFAAVAVLLLIAFYLGMLVVR